MSRATGLVRVARRIPAARRLLSASCLPGRAFFAPSTHSLSAARPFSIRWFSSEETNSSSTLQRPYQYLSFYHYVPLQNISALHQQLSTAWAQYGVLGRIYISSEGINAQTIVPLDQFEAFGDHLHSFPPFASIFLNRGDVLPAGTLAPFSALHIRIKEQIVADGCESGEKLDWQAHRPTYLEPDQWNEKLETDQPILLDCRNWYESRIGRFDGAIQLESENHREVLQEIATKLKGREDQKVLMYCTGGIRCEKIGTLMKQELGFRDVSQLRGGINHYALYAKENPQFVSKFLGKNFVFDQRIHQGNETERVTSDVLSTCDQCGQPADTHTNCQNNICGLLFIQCASCAQKYHHTCSDACHHVTKLTPAQQKNLANYIRWLKGTHPNHGLTYRRKFEKDNPFMLRVLSLLAETQLSLVPTVLEDYCTKHTSPVSPLLQQIEAGTLHKWPGAAHMISGPLQTQLLAFLVGFVGARRVLEIGTFTGYSALGMAEALPEDGVLVTCETNQGVAVMAQKFFQQHPAGHKIQMIVKPAMDVLHTLVQTEVPPFDFIFLDADKMGYRGYYDFILQHGLLSKKGVLCIDNVLWKGSVLTEELLKQFRTDKRAQSIADFNDYVAQDPRVKQVMLPIRDGLLLIRLADS